MQTQEHRPFGSAQGKQECLCHIRARSDRRGRGEPRPYKGKNKARRRRKAAPTYLVVATGSSMKLSCVGVW
jgi:hypothetical protein